MNLNQIMKTKTLISRLIRNIKEREEIKKSFRTMAQQEWRIDIVVIAIVGLIVQGSRLTSTIRE